MPATSIRLVDNWIFHSDSQGQASIVPTAAKYQLITVDSLYNQDYYLNSNLTMLQYFAENKGAEPARFTPQDFLFRWKKLERIIQKEALDGLLLVTGIDGSEHPNTSYLFNWLFLGLSGPSILSNRYLDPIFAEMIVFASNRESFIFVTPSAKRQIDHLIYALPNCTVFCPTDKEYSSKDEFQILKIAFFYRAVSKASKIGFYLQANQEMKIIEKWPIIQSFALEPVGKTFFTLKYQTSNISSKITPLFKNLDRHSLKNMVSQNAYTLEGQIRGSTQYIEYTKQSERNLITELKLQQPLFEAVDISSQQAEQQRAVRVVFGPRTATNQPSGQSTILSTKAFHFTIEHFDPFTKLQVWRTYFLDNNLKKVRSVVVTDEEEKESFITKKKYLLKHEQNTEFPNRLLILNSYIGLVQAVIDGIATVSKDYRNLKRQFLMDHILAKLSQTNGEQYAKQNLEVILESFDSMGEPRPIDFKDSITFKLTSTFYVLKCRLNNIQSKEKQNLGSVCFSECFLLQEGCYLLLTKNTPYFDFWKTSPEQSTLLQKLNPNIEFSQLGACTSTDFRNRLFVPLQKWSNIHFNLPILNVRYYFHEKGLRIFHEKIGWHLLLYSEIQSASMINRISGQWVLFQTKNCFLFDGIQSNILALEFRGKAFEYLLKKVNDKTDALVLSFLDVVPQLLSQNWYFTQQVLKKQVKEGSLLHQHQILQSDFLWSFIEAKQLMVLNQMKDIKLTAFRAIYQQKVDRKLQEIPPSAKQSLLIINGTYATGKLRLAQTIAKYGSNEQQYHIFNISSENLFAKMEVSTFLQVLAEFIGQYQGQNNCVFIVVIPSWLNCTETLPLLSQRYHIRSIATKISAGNFFSSKNGLLTENVLTFTVPGFCQSIILDCQGEDESLITSLTRIVWGFNRQSRFMRSSNSMLSTGQCNDILKDNSYNTEYQKFLRSKYGSLFKFDQLSQLSVNYLEFKYPLFDIAAIKSLAGEEGYLVDRTRLEEQLRPKKIEAQNSKDELMEGLYRLQEYLTYFRKRQKVPQLRCLRGVVQLHNQQRVEIMWANQIYKQRTTAQQEKTLGLYILSKNYEVVLVKEFLLNLTNRKFILQNLKPLVAQSSLTEEQILAISRDGRDKYLTDGQFYDGYFYRNDQGHILPAHPKLPQLIAQHISNINRQIQEANQQTRNEWQAYCKKYD